MKNIGEEKELESSDHSAGLWKEEGREEDWAGRDSMSFGKLMADSPALVFLWGSPRAHRSGPPQYIRLIPPEFQKAKLVIFKFVSSLAKDCSPGKKSSQVEPHGCFQEDIANTFQWGCSRHLGWSNGISYKYAYIHIFLENGKSEN